MRELTAEWKKDLLVIMDNIHDVESGIRASISLCLDTVILNDLLRMINTLSIYMKHLEDLYLEGKNCIKSEKSV